MTKYKTILDEVNSAIESFNRILAPEYKLATIDFTDPKSCSSIVGVAWNNQFWPHKDTPGVYLLFGYRESQPDGQQLGLYIGKSSLRDIGTRVYNWLHPHRLTGTYRVNDRAGEPYVIEFISAIPVPERRLGSLASAIEEHVITTVRGDVHLLNAVGNPE